MSTYGTAGEALVDLFQSGNFHLHSGTSSNFKIDCDALTDADIQTVAMLLKERLPDFGNVEGVPRGGLRLAGAMRRYVTSGPVLIVDDVWTTGGSIWKVRGDREDVIGAVIFARGDTQSWVTALFRMR